MKTYDPHKSSLGMDANIMALLTYVAMAIVAAIPWLRFVAFAAPVVIYFMESQSDLVRYHALQATVLGIVSVALLILSNLPLLGILFTIANAAVFLVALYAAYGAYKYQELRIPVASIGVDILASALKK